MSEKKISTTSYYSFLLMLLLIIGIISLRPTISGVITAIIVAILFEFVSLLAAIPFIGWGIEIWLLFVILGIYHIPVTANLPIELAVIFYIIMGFIVTIIVFGTLLTYAS
ncbi:MAG: hypothetical protein QXL94_00400 [Candidatus Parvarchaeum sp.]